MRLFAKFFWLVLPVALAVGTYREANSAVRRYWAFSQEREAVSSTQKDLNRMLMQLGGYYKMTRKLPPDLKGFLEQMPDIGLETRTRPAHVDAWHTPYELHDLDGRYEVVSCGPDRDCADANDNLVEGAIKVVGTTPGPGGGDKLGKVLKNAEQMQKAVDEHNKQIEEAP